MDKWFQMIFAKNPWVAVNAIPPKKENDTAGIFHVDTEPLNLRCLPNVRQQPVTETSMLGGRESLFKLARVRK